MKERAFDEGGREVHRAQLVRKKPTTRQNISGKEQR